MINYDSLLSDQVKHMQPSGIRKFFDVAAMMEGVISLGVGEPDFQTPWVVRKEAVDILERKRIIYSANSGMINLRKEIANYLNRKYDLTYDQILKSSQPLAVRKPLTLPFVRLSIREMKC